MRRSSSNRLLNSLLPEYFVDAACLKILRREPNRGDLLEAVTGALRVFDLGLVFESSESPSLPPGSLVRYTAMDVAVRFK